MYKNAQMTYNEKHLLSSDYAYIRCPSRFCLIEESEKSDSSVIWVYTTTIKQILFLINRNTLYQGSQLILSLTLWSIKFMSEYTT